MAWRCKFIQVEDSEGEVCARIQIKMGLFDAWEQVSWNEKTLYKHMLNPDAELPSGMHRYANVDQLKRAFNGVQTEKNSRDIPLDVDVAL